MAYRVTLNVGGTVFETTSSTIDASDNFSKYVKEHPSLIDRDPTHFRHVLNCLRGTPTLPPTAHGVLELKIEADVYGIEALSALAADRLRYG